MLLHWVNRNGFYSLNMQALVTTVGSTQLSWLGKLHFPQLEGLLAGDGLHCSPHNNIQAVRVVLTAFTPLPWAMKPFQISKGHMQAYLVVISCWIDVESALTCQPTLW